MNKHITKGRQRTLKLIQHIVLAAAVGIIAYTSVESNVYISGLNGKYSYSLNENRTAQKKYEDSYLFNNILGNNVSNAIRLTAIKSQLETDGKYDPDKKIDVTAYVNRGTSLPGDYITAVYKISDLLKWSSSGFEYSTVSIDDSRESFLNNTTTYTHLKNNIMSGGMNSFLNSQIPDNSETQVISGNSINNNAENGSHTVLINRYKTVDGKNVEDLVSDWSDYQELCSNIEDAAKDLYTNYEEYIRDIAYYQYDKTNLRYYISRTVAGTTDIYTNVDSLENETTGVDINAFFKEYGKYMYFCPYELDYQTNTLITEDTLRNIIRDYEYCYPDQIKVYIGVDTEHYSASDEFTQGRDAYSKYLPNQRNVIIVSAILLFTYLLLLIFILRMEGHQTGKDITQANDKRIILEKYDSIPIELIVFIDSMLLFLIIYSAYMIIELNELNNMPVMLTVMAVATFLSDLIILSGLCSLTRRLKAETLWNSSLLYMILSSIKKFVFSSIDSGNVAVRVWIPYIIFLLCNLVLFSMSLPGIVVALCIDAFTGIEMYRMNTDRQKIINGIRKIRNGNFNYKVDASGFHGDNIVMAEAVNSIGDGIDRAVSMSAKDEKLKADLITNVSHDIKTPLTSIINYVDLLKRANIQDETIRGYIDILDTKSQRLKQLTVDLVDASKISSGCISVEMDRINLVELINQTIGEFYEKFEQRKLTPIFKHDADEIFIMADSRHLWRVIENLLNNVFKYALENTRVYLDMKIIGENELNVVTGTPDRIETDKKSDNTGKYVVFSIKNISSNELNIDASELTERFIRGDVSRSSEGSGLGLSIAKSLTQAQNGRLEIALDGDLFKVSLIFELAM